MNKKCSEVSKNIQFCTQNTNINYYPFNETNKQTNKQLFKFQALSLAIIKLNPFKDKMINPTVA